MLWIHVWMFGACETDTTCVFCVQHGYMHKLNNHPSHHSKQTTATSGARDLAQSRGSRVVGFQPPFHITSACLHDNESRDLFGRIDSPPIRPANQTTAYACGHNTPPHIHTWEHNEAESSHIIIIHTYGMKRILWRTRRAQTFFKVCVCVFFFSSCFFSRAKIHACVIYQGFFFVSSVVVVAAAAVAAAG